MREAKVWILQQSAAQLHCIPDTAHPQVCLNSVTRTRNVRALERRWVQWRGLPILEAPLSLVAASVNASQHAHAPPLRVVKLRQVRQSRASSSAARNCSISILLPAQVP